MGATASTAACAACRTGTGRLTGRGTPPAITYRRRRWAVGIWDQRTSCSPVAGATSSGRASRIKRRAPASCCDACTAGVVSLLGLRLLAPTRSTTPHSNTTPCERLLPPTIRQGAFVFDVTEMAMMGTPTNMAFRRTWKQSQQQATAAMRKYAAAKSDTEARRFLVQAHGYIADALDTDRRELPQQWIDKPHTRRIRRR